MLVQSLAVGGLALPVLLTPYSNGGPSDAHRLRLSTAGETVERKEFTPLDRQQAKALIEAASDDRLEALYLLAVHTGIREGELLGLKWEDVDLERGLLRLRHALVREGGKVALDDLKTPKSRRTASDPPAPPLKP
jgi:integrase